MRFVGALPLQSGTTPDVDRWVSEMTGPQHAAYDALMRSGGAQDASYWLVPTSVGEIVVVVMTVDDVDQFFSVWLATPSPFADWWTEQMRRFHGEPGEGEGAGRCFFHWSAR
jgi:hypothetical protein